MTLALFATAGVLISLLLLSQALTMWLTRRYERRETPLKRTMRRQLTERQPR